MKSTIPFAVAALAALTTSGCLGGVKTEGAQAASASQNLDLKGFDQIEVSGSAEVVVTVGSAESIKLEGSKDRIESVTTELKDSRLVIKEKSFELFGGNDGPLKITITLPTLKAFTLNGSGNATVTGVKSPTFAGVINGSGELVVTGESDKADFVVNGSGDILADSFKSKTSTVTIAGSGDATVNASDALTVSIAGSGDVKYFGEPKKVTKSVNGSGDVSKG